MRSINPDQISIFGPKNEYLILVSLPKKVVEEIQQMKQKLNIEFGGEICDLYSIAHITLSSVRSEFEDYPDFVKKLISGAKAFPIKIEGWGRFDIKKKDEKNYIFYLKINEPLPLVALMKSLKFTNHIPHMTVANNVCSEYLRNVERFFDNLNYTAEWKCTDL